ncbi:intracellular septation protein A [Rhizomicrobium palustre]|jgi:intracellular septation protein A|uniref:Intracellular septation protein A n=1 Tax=Rhizomicrobium palustre TaxID=189966 RepID=A0A846MV60_9PROT|nr:septation protein IspZ [Rhizomicrobium palustre]NIK87344.1 intracellular septation protein A [Rhizomicrobium palustre]
MLLVKAVLPILRDLLATFVFVALFWTVGVYPATAVGISLIVAQTLYMHFRGHKIGALHWLSLVLIATFGGLTILFHRPHFIMIKPSLLWFALGVVMLRRDWMEPYLPPFVVAHLEERQIAKAGYAYAALMFVLAVANVVVVKLFSPNFWAAYALLGPTLAQAVLFGIFYLCFHKQIAAGMRAEKQKAAA